MTSVDTLAALVMAGVLLVGGWFVWSVDGPPGLTPAGAGFPPRRALAGGLLGAAVCGFLWVWLVVISYPQASEGVRAPELAAGLIMVVSGWYGGALLSERRSG